MRIKKKALLNAHFNFKNVKGQSAINKRDNRSLQSSLNFLPQLSPLEKLECLANIKNQRSIILKENEAAITIRQTATYLRAITIANRKRVERVRNKINPKGVKGSSAERLNVQKTVVEPTRINRCDHDNFPRTFSSVLKNGNPLH